MNGDHCMVDIFWTSEAAGALEGAVIKASGRPSCLSFSYFSLRYVKLHLKSRLVVEKGAGSTDFTGESDNRVQATRSSPCHHSP